PFGFSTCVSENVPISHMIEPRRGPATQISLRVVAVNDSNSILGEGVGRKRIEVGKRQTDRSRQMRSLVFFLGQDLHERGAVRRQPLHLFTSDHLHLYLR